MAKTRKKQHVETSCYELARERLAYVFDRFDHVAVSFSGGKDSTVCLQLTLQLARERGRLPLDVFTYDEEAIPPETVEYMQRIVETQPEIAFRWFCVPIQHRNACSNEEPLWWPWAPEARAKWVRELPPTAILDYPGFHRAGIGEQMAALYPPDRGTVAVVMGIRTQESLSRYHAVASKEGFRAFMTVTDGITKVYPIYDWATEDVWIAPAKFGWDYNRAYDTMEAAGLTRHDQRCAPPYGEQPIRRLHTYKTCWPELWAKMVDRVAGAATAARYANTELYGIGVDEADLPAGKTWRQWTMETLRALPPGQQQEAAFAIRVCLSIHRNRTAAPMPDLEPDLRSGMCWKTLYLAAKIGGDEFGRVQQKMMNAAIRERKRTGAAAR